MVDSINNFIVVANELASASKVFEKTLDDLKKLQIDSQSTFDFDKELTKTRLPLTFFQNRLRTLSSLFIALGSEISRETFSVTQLRELVSNAQQVNLKITELQTHISNVKGKGGFKATTWDNIEIGTPDGLLNLELEGGVLLPVLGWTDRIIEAYTQILVLINPESLQFRHAVESAEAARREIEQAKATVAKANSQISTIASTVLKLEKDTQVGASRVAASVNEIIETAKKFKDDLSQTEGDTKQKKAVADAVLAAASELKKQVDDYAATFSAFQKVIDQRNDAWTKGQNSLATLIVDLAAKKSEIADIIVKANEMLATATNAGLTAAQDSRFKELGVELREAESAVNWSYGFLALSMAPLAAYVLQNFGETLKFDGGLEYLANIFLRALLFFPAVLFVTFTSSRYKKLFRLKHEYGYRASLAGAVEGFQKRAPEHEKDIAAVAFYQLGRNPAEAIDGPAEQPHWYEKLHDIILRFGDRFGASKSD